MSIKESGEEGTEHRPDGTVSHGVEEGAHKQCTEGCTNCTKETGWSWKHSDLGHTNHRGKMWAVPCPHYPKAKRIWDSELGKFRPPAPIGIDEERMHRYMTHNWDKNRSKDSFASESRHERSAMKQQDGRNY